MFSGRVILRCGTSRGPQDYPIKLIVAALAGHKITREMSRFYAKAEKLSSRGLKHLSIVIFKHTIMN